MLTILLAAVLPLFENGSTAWKVVVPPDAQPCVRFAAEEFTNALGRVSGAYFEIVPAAVGSSPSVVIASEGDVWGDEIVEYRLKDGNLLLTGNQPRAALHATYAFLQRELGVRWLWPGADGEVFPKRTSWSFPKDFGYRHVPSIRFRGFHHCGAWRDRDAFNLWQTRNFSVIHRHGVRKGEEKYGQYSMVSTHNANLSKEEKLFAESPECFAVIDGKRSRLNICFSSDLAVQRVADRIDRDLAYRGFARPPDILSIFPIDNMDYCQCEACRGQGISTAWFSFYNKLVVELKRRHPDIRFATIAYQGYLDPPACRIENTEFVEYASHPRCHIHLWGDPKCAANVREMKRMNDWRARGDAAIGHYAYEYDAVNRHAIFLPFFSMIADVIDTAVSQKLVTVIPEVGLGPAKGPEERVNSVQNRLTELLYAWKSWDASLTLEAFFDDVTKNAYGPAAAPLKEYFKLMDEAWGRLPGKISLFADGFNVSANLLADEKIRTRTAELIAKAEKLVRASGDEREIRNVLREKALYGQIVENRSFKLGNVQTFNLPHLGKGDRLTADRAPGVLLKSAADRDGSVRVRGCWTDEEIAFKWQGTEAAEVAFAVDGAQYFFAFKGGAPSARMISDVGIESRTWKPDWRAGAAGGGLVFRIPLSLFPRRPSAGVAWDVHFAAGAEALPFAEDVTMKFAFIAASAADRPLVYYIGDRPALKFKRDRQLAGIRSEGEGCGWRVTICTNKAQLAAAVTAADTYWLDVPDAKCLDPETAAVIRDRVKAGGTILLGGWTEMPLSRFLADPELKCRPVAPKSFTLGERKAKFVLDGDWCRKPWNVERDVRKGYAPCYLMAFDMPGAVEYAGMPSAADETKISPFISALRYGKGLIILIGEDTRVSHFKLIDNLRADRNLRGR